jgi:plastocyanin
MRAFLFLNRGGMQHRRAGRMLLLAAALLGASCAPDALAGPKVHTVVIEAMKFSPEIVEVRPGDIVVWKNKDAFPHAATADNRGFDSGEIAANRSWKFKALKKGVFPYICTLHPTMKGKLVVK